MTWYVLTELCVLQLMADAAAIDAKAASGQSIKPLCGLPLAVKDSIDVLGYPTTASTPALLSTQLNAHACSHVTWHVSCFVVSHASCMRNPA